MARTTKRLSVGLSAARLKPKPFKSSELSLVILRYKELDREFARQTRHLAALTKRLQRRVSDHFMPSKEKK